MQFTLNKIWYINNETKNGEIKYFLCWMSLTGVDWGWDCVSSTWLVLYFSIDNKSVALSWLEILDLNIFISYIECGKARVSFHLHFVKWMISHWLVPWEECRVHCNMNGTEISDTSRLWNRNRNKMLTLHNTTSKMISPWIGTVVAFQRLAASQSLRDMLYGIYITSESWL